MEDNPLSSIGGSRAVAEFRSKCASCGEWIEEGDEIALDEDEEWVHKECF